MDKAREGWKRHPFARNLKGFCNLEVCKRYSGQPDGGSQPEIPMYITPAGTPKNI